MRAVIASALVRARPTYLHISAVLVGLSYLGLFPVSPASGADSGQAEALIREGIQLRQAGNDHRALPFFRQAYDLQPTPRTAAQLGLVEFALGYVIEAERHLLQSLAAEHDLWINKNRKTLEGTLAGLKAHIGELVISGSPVGAEVHVNRQLVGRLPVTKAVRLGEGPAVVEVRASGYLREERIVAIRGGAQEQIDVNLRADAKPESEPSTPTNLAGNDVAKQLGNHRSTLARPAAWVLAVGSVAGLAFGVAETIVWRNRTDEFHGHVRQAGTDPKLLEPDCGTDEPGRGGVECAEIYNGIQKARNLLILGYASAGVLAAGSAVLFLFSTTSRSEVGLAYSCSPAVGIRGAVCGFRF